MKSEQITDELIDRIFKSVDEAQLSDWEVKFVKSTREWWGKRRKLSDKQKNRLVELWRKQTNEPRRA